MIQLFIFFLLLFANTELCAKVRILTFHCNQAQFIEMQYKTLSKFLKDDFELIVFNDAKTAENEKKIEDACYEYQIKCVRFKPEWHLTDPLNTYLKNQLEDPSTIGIWGWNAATSFEEFANHASVRHCHVIQYALDHYGYDHDDIVVIFDGDNFLIKPLSIRELLGENDIVGFNQWPDHQAQQRLKGELSVPKGMEMPWVVFIAFDPRKLPNVREMQFHVDVVSGHPHLPNNTISDTGAAIYKYLWKHPSLQLQMYPWQLSYTYRCLSPGEFAQLQLSDRVIKFIHDIAPENVQFFLFEHFMHIAGGSWEGNHAGHQNKLFHTQQFIYDLVK